jgi:two-component system sensor histidine kinase MprB
LERAVTNLLDNAAKWSPEKGTVHVTLEQGTLTVDDEGHGIPEEDLPHVFDRFYRSAESRGMPGSGLGLAIVRQVAERTGGTVVAERSPYGGARLVLRLPGAVLPMPRTVPPEAWVR